MLKSVPFGTDPFATTGGAMVQPIPLPTDERMKRMMKTYLALVLGIPVLLTASCFLFRDIPAAGVLVYAIPVIMLAVFMWRVFSVNPKRKALHVAGGLLCMIGTWLLSSIVLGAIAISQTGLGGTR